LSIDIYKGPVREFTNTGNYAYHSILVKQTQHSMIR